MFLQLGTYKFEGVKLPTSWGGNYATEYAQIPIIGGKPVVQKIGEKLVEFEIIVRLSDEFCDPREELKALQLLRRNGVVNQLTGGDGVNYGKYVITEITDNPERAESNGYISSLLVTIKLLEYNTTKTTIKQTGTAVSSVEPMPEAPLVPLTPISGEISNDIQTGIVETDNINTELKKDTPNYNKVAEMTDKAMEAWEAADTKIQATKNIVLRAVNLRNTLASAQLAAQALKEAAQANDPEEVYAANTVLGRAAYQVKGASVPLIAFIGSREAGN